MHSGIDSCGKNSWWRLGSEENKLHDLRRRKEEEEIFFIWVGRLLKCSVARVSDGTKHHEKCEDSHA